MDPFVRWSFIGALVVTGCGARTLAGDDTEVDTPLRMPPGDANASDEDATTQDAAVEDEASPFFICPPRFPTAGTACDTQGQVCAYVGPGSLCKSFECAITGNATTLLWQNTQLGC